jgi:hypothetical protein
MLHASATICLSYFGMIIAQIEHLRQLLNFAFTLYAKWGQCCAATILS